MKSAIKFRRRVLYFHRRVILRAAAFWQAHWGQRSFLIAIAAGIGILAAVAASVLHALVTYFEELNMRLTEPQGQFGSLWLLLLLILPMIGLVASFLVQRFMGGPRYAKSLSPLILQLTRRRTNIPLRETWSHMLSSALSVGFGGSAGLEAPSVLTGAAIGANSAGFLNVSRKHRNLLLGCGAAAAISAIFNSPIAGVLFAAEVLLPEISISALVPLVMSSAIAAVISRLIAQMTGGTHFFFATTEQWRLDAIPCYLLLGVFCALIGVYVIRSAYYLGDKLKSRFRSPWHRLFVGGSLLCVLLFLFPVLRGQGYIYIEKLFAGNLGEIADNSLLLSYIPSETLILVLVIVAVLLLKVVASVLTVDSGGDGGIFAPSMVVGAFAGFAFARILNLTGLVELQECNFVVVGMCGVFTAVMRAPLTGIFLIAEVTGGYVLLVPLMIVSAVSALIAHVFEPNSIYRKALVENKLIAGNRDMILLHSQSVRANLERNFHPLKSEQTLAWLTGFVEKNPGEVFPVLDENGHLIGIVYLERILSAMLNPNLYDLLLVADLMEHPAETLFPEDDLAHAMTGFEQYDLKYLPVCNKEGLFLGFISKANLFTKYRTILRESTPF